MNVWWNERENWVGMIKVNIIELLYVILYFPRCGADPTIKDKDGLSAEEILTEKRPPGWEETWHWFQKFRPGSPIGKN